MARNSADSTGGLKRPVLSALSIFCACCMVFSGASFAQDTPEPGAQATSAESTQAVTAQPAVSENAPADVDAELEAILKNNNRCLRCHTRDRTKDLGDGTALSLKIHREDFVSSAHGEVAVENALEGAAKPFEAPIPSAVYTFPSASTSKPPEPASIGPASVPTWPTSNVCASMIVRPPGTYSAVAM